MSSKTARIELIESIHDSKLKLAIALTGGGSGLISELLSIPGASQTILEANVPYSKESLTQFLGRTPESFCSSDTSQMMAVQAYFNSIQTHSLPSNGEGVTAIGCTAALASNSPKKGDHRFFKSIQTSNMTLQSHVILHKGSRTRAEEEKLLVEIGLSELAQLIGVEYQPEGLTTKDRLQKHRIEVSKEWADVFHGIKTACCANRQGEPAPRGAGILAGSFNPLHQGHLEMASIYEKRFGKEVHFELAIRNADKPPIDYLTITNRVNQFAQQPVWLTHAATFVEKSRLFPGNQFIVGIDTIARIANPSYYAGLQGFREAIAEIKKNDCRFVVCGRYDGNKFLTLSDLEIDREVVSLCDQIPESDFRQDVSSTTIRIQSLPESSRNPAELFG